MRVLIVEDEEKISKSLAAGLQSEGINTEQAFDGEEALEILFEDEFDVVILDLMLPKKSGEEVCTILREKQVNVPILMLTAKGTNEDIINGLNLGADDYLAKPFNFDELLARVKALSRRPAQNLNYKITYNNILCDTQKRQVTEGKNHVELTKKEYEIVELLLLNKSKVISKEKILDDIWGFDSEALPNNVEVYINSIRKKFKTDFIFTKRGFGYYVN